MLVKGLIDDLVEADETDDGRSNGGRTSSFVGMDFSEVDTGDGRSNTGSTLEVDCGVDTGDWYGFSLPVTDTNAGAFRSGSGDDADISEPVDWA